MERKLGPTARLCLENFINEYDNGTQTLVRSIDNQLVGKVKASNIVDSISTLGEMANENMIRCNLLTENRDEQENCQETIIAIREARVSQIAALLKRYFKME